MTRFTRAAVAALLVWIAPASAGPVARGDSPTGRVEPDPVMQAAIEEAVTAVARQDDTASERLEALRQLGEGRRGVLLLQLAIHLEDSTGTERSMAGALVLHHLDFTPEEKIETILPHLETSGAGLHRVLEEILGTFDRREGGEADYGAYETWLRRRKDPRPEPLIRHMYTGSPDAALAVMQRVYGAPGPERRQTAASLAELREILARRGDASGAWPDADGARARSALEALSRDPGWWVRLYAASVAGRHPGLAAAALRLKEDPDPLVRGSIPR